jgi:hypothetical protein
VLVGLAYVDDLRAVERQDLGGRQEVAHQGDLSSGLRPTFSYRPARSQGFMALSAGAGGGAVSRRNCSIAATTAAASSGEAAV